MKASDPSAYNDIASIKTTTTYTALGKPFRGLVLSTSAAGTITFTITTVHGKTRTGILFAVQSNDTILVPIAGNDIIVTATTGGGTWTAYALI